MVWIVIWAERFFLRVLLNMWCIAYGMYQSPATEPVLSAYCDSVRYKCPYPGYVTRLKVEADRKAALLRAVPYLLMAYISMHSGVEQAGSEL